LKKLGWGALVLWECQLADLEKLSRRIHRFLE
jgi:G:T-mismatch repair DNA endonuclease (very short patch repair protein)